MGLTDQEAFHSEDLEYCSEQWSGLEVDYGRCGWVG